MINKYIDYTYLKYGVTKRVKEFVDTAKMRRYYGVCVQPSYIPIVKQRLDSDLKLISVAGFPDIRSWADIARHPMGSLALGLYRKVSMYRLYDVINSPDVDELDLIFPFLWYSTGNKLRITKFLTGIKKRFRKPVKVIVEMGTVFKKEKNIKDINKILVDSGIDYLKTNSGILKQSFEDLYRYLKYLKESITLPIKASGGITTLEQVEDLIDLGVSRIGTSKDVYNEE